jgi:hypothetical protein
MMTFTTPSGSMAGGQPVDATATFTTGSNTLTIVLTNLQANPKGDSQSINGLIFSFTTTPTAVSVSSSSAVQRTVNSDGSYADAGSATPTNWTVSFSSPTVTLTALGGSNSQATETIIGPPAGDGMYDAAKGSIAGSVHNPFLAQTATFVLNVQGITAATDIASVQFAYGTTAGTGVGATAVPEPSSVALLGLGVAAGLVARRRLLRAKAAGH